VWVGLDLVRTFLSPPVFGKSQGQRYAAVRSLSAAANHNTGITVYVMYDGDGLKGKASRDEMEGEGGGDLFVLELGFVFLSFTECKM
jgi:hypothetical protein